MIISGQLDFKTASEDIFLFINKQIERRLSGQERDKTNLVQNMKYHPVSHI